MANTIDQDLMAQLLSDSPSSVTGTVVDRIHYNHVPESYEGAYIFFRRTTAGDDEDRSLDDRSGRKYELRETFDLEGISRTLGDEVSLMLEIKKLDSHLASLGNGTCQAVFVRNHDDDYVPKGVDSDEGYFVGSVEIEIVGYAEGA